MTKGDKLLIESIPEALAQTDYLCSSINVASSKAGINMDAVFKRLKLLKNQLSLQKIKMELDAAN